MQAFAGCRREIYGGRSVSPPYPPAPSPTRREEEQIGAASFSSFPRPGGRNADRRSEGWGVIRSIARWDQAPPLALPLAAHRPALCAHSPEHLLAVEGCSRQILAAW